MAAPALLLDPLINKIVYLGLGCPCLVAKGRTRQCVARGLYFSFICDSIILKTDRDLHNCKSFLR